MIKGLVTRAPVFAGNKRRSAWNTSPCGGAWNIRAADSGGASRCSGGHVDGHLLDGNEKGTV